MGMTIDELVETAQKYNCMIVTKEMWNTALGNSHKLQKIEEIVNGWSRYRNGISSSEGDSIYMQMVSKVLEDGEK